MTDKEKLDKLVAEIKRLRKEVKDNIAELGNSESERIGLFNDLEIYDNILSFIDSMQKEPASEELEEAANEYAKDYLFTPKPQRAPNIHFINGANWQKQQMMAKAVKVNISNASIVSLPVNCDLKVGDKVLIIKED